MIKVSSTAFDYGKPIPMKYTGEGQDIPPEISWNDTPNSTKEFVLICEDPDAPVPDSWIHWVVYKIHPSKRSLPEGGPDGEVVEGRNTAGGIGYMGPMPPPGHGVHHYHFKILALDRPITAEPGLTKDQVLKIIKEDDVKILDYGELIGTYERV